jgi:AAA domain/Domain of unknown function (DUF3854)
MTSKLPPVSAPRLEPFIPGVTPVDDNSNPINPPYVPSVCQEMLGNPEIMLIITDTHTSADAAAELGLCCIAIDGPWGWYDKQRQQPRGQLENIACNNGRQVLLSFDPWIWLDDDGATGLTRLANLLTGRGGEVDRLCLNGPLSEFLIADNLDLADLHDHVRKIPGVTQPPTPEPPTVPVINANTELTQEQYEAWKHGNVLDEYQLAEAKRRLRAQRQAKRELDAEENPPQPLPDGRNLADLLAAPRTETPFLIGDLAPAGGRVLLAAPGKAGKTTLIQNVIRSLADGKPFLSRFTIDKPCNRIVLIDTEMTANQLTEWMDDQNIGNVAAVDIWTLRGSVGTFDLLDKRCRAKWADKFAGADYLILDCLRPVLDALGLDESHDAGKFLVAFDTLLADAAIPDALIAHHMGHGAERARGDSRLIDWPDATWKIVRDEKTDARYFSANGRDVDVWEGRLAFDAASRQLSYAGGSRTHSETEAAKPAVVDFLIGYTKAHGTGPTAKTMETDMHGGEHSRKSVRAALAELVSAGVVITAKGAHNATAHTIANGCLKCGRPPLVATWGHRPDFDCGTTSD